MVKGKKKKIVADPVEAFDDEGDNHDSNQIGEHTDVGPLFDDAKRAQMSGNADGSARLALITAIEEVVGERKQVLNATSFSAAVLTALESHPNAEDVVGNLLFLLAAIIRRVSIGVLRSKGQLFSSAAIAAMSAHPESVRVAKPGLECIGVVIRAQDANSFKANQEHYLTSFMTLLQHTTDHRPKARRSAQLSLAAIIGHGDRKMVHSILEPCFIRYFDANFVGSGDAGVNKMYVCSTARMFIGALSPKCGMEIGSKFLEKLDGDDVGMCLGVFGSIGALFASCSTQGKQQVTAQQISKLLSSAIKCRPYVKGGLGDVAITYCQMVCQGIVVLHRLEPLKAVKHLTTALHYIMDNFLSIFSDQVYEATATALCLMLEEMVDVSGVEEDGNTQSIAAKAATRATHGTMANILDVMMEAVHVRYRHAWQYSIRVIGQYFISCGKCGGAFPLLKGLLLTLEEMQHHIKGTEHTVVSAAIACALQSDGPEKFLHILPLTSNVDPSQPLLELERGWIVPLLRDHLPPSPLSYWIEHLLPLAERLRMSAVHVEEKLPVASKNAMMVFGQIWEVMPSFLQHATDLPKSFATLTQLFVKILREDPTLHSYVCRGLSLVIKSNLKVANPDDEMEHEDEEQRQCKFDIDPETAKENLEILAVQAQSIIPAIFDACLTIQKSGERSILLETATTITSIASTKLISNITQFILKKLLNKESTDKQLHLDLLMTLSSGIKGQTGEIALRTISTFLTNEDPPIQKKSYKLFYKIALVNPDASILSPAIKTIIEALPVCHGGSRKSRMLCIHALIQGTPTSHKTFNTLIQNLLPEVLLGCKEANHKTREIALETMVTCAHKFHSFDDDSNRLREFIFMVIAGLAGESPHMVSASVVALSRLLFEYPQFMLGNIPELFPAILLLLKHSSREIVAAAIGFVKVFVVSAPLSYLEDKLAEIVSSLLCWSDDSKDRFRLKIRVIFERLVRKAGFDNVNAYVPEEYKHLMTYIRKANERKKKKANKEENQGSNFDRMMDDDGDDDEDDDGGFIEKYDRKSKKSHDRMVDDDDDEYDDDDDILGARGVSSNQRKSQQQQQNQQPKRSSWKTLVTDDTGRAMIQDPEQPPTAKKRRAMESYVSQAMQELGIDTAAADEENNRETGSKRFRDDYDDNQEEEDVKPNKSWGDGSFKRQVKKKRQQHHGGPQVLGGEEFRPNKAGVGGDVKKPGRPDPFAYVPLDPRALNKRKSGTVQRRYDDLFKANKETKDLRKQNKRK